MSNETHWHAVRLCEELRVFGRHPGTYTLYDERSNFKKGDLLVIAPPEQLLLVEERRTACRVLRRNGSMCQLVTYVLVSDFRDPALLQQARDRLGIKQIQ